MKPVYTSLLSLLFLSACSVDQEITFTNSLCEAIATGDDMSVRYLIDELCAGSNPKPTTNDIFGQEANLNELIRDINATFDCAQASFVCYACIETYPPISVIRVEVNYGTDTNFVVIDILTPDDDELSFAGMH
jgi:hypothetical protein